MELAIPLIALGGLYVISNQKKKETFTTTRQPNVKPNVKPLITMHDTKKVFEKTKK